jgi:hypothetical protein
MLRDPSGPETYLKHVNPNVDGRDKVIRGSGWDTPIRYAFGFLRVKWHVAADRLIDEGFRPVCNVRK